VVPLPSIYNVPFRPPYHRPYTANRQPNRKRVKSLAHVRGGRWSGEEEKNKNQNIEKVSFKLSLKDLKREGQGMRREEGGGGRRWWRRSRRSRK
jgi:hypothetical protein